MNCKNCGKENSEGTEFCVECGLRLKYQRYEFEKYVPIKTPFYHSKGFYIKLMVLSSVMMVILIYITLIEPI